MGNATHDRTLKSYRKRRDELITAMGGKCQHCGTADRSKLQFHHTSPRSWKASQKARWVRIAIYWREFEAGMLELACADCNKRLGVPEGEDDGGYF